MLPPCCMLRRKLRYQAAKPPANAPRTAPVKVYERMLIAASETGTSEPGGSVATIATPYKAPLITPRMRPTRYDARGARKPAMK